MQFLESSINELIPQAHLAVYLEYGRYVVNVQEAARIEYHTIRDPESVCKGKRQFQSIWQLIFVRAENHQSINYH